MAMDSVAAVTMVLASFSEDLQASTEGYKHSNAIEYLLKLYKTDAKHFPFSKLKAERALIWSVFPYIYSPKFR